MWQTIIEMGGGSGSQNTSFSPHIMLWFGCFSPGCLVCFSFVFIFVLFAYGDVFNNSYKTLYKYISSQFFSRTA